MKYLQEGRGVWHIAVPDTDIGLTLCRRYPAKHWDQETTERPAGEICPRCEGSAESGGKPYSSNSGAEPTTPPHYHVISSGQGVVAGDWVLASKSEAEAIAHRLRETRPEAHVDVRECEAEACAPPTIR